MTWTFAAIFLGLLNLLWAAMILSGRLRFHRAGASPICASCPLREAQLSRIPLSTVEADSDH